MIHISPTNLTRIMNAARNKFWNLVPKALQKAVFRMESGDQATDLQGWLPTWVYTESPTLAAGDSDDASMGLQNGFSLMAFVGSAVKTDSSAPAGTDFTVQIADVGEGKEFTSKPIYNGLMAGRLGTALFMNEAYEFQGDEPQCSIRITNTSGVQAGIQFAIFGYVPPMSSSRSRNLAPVGA
jgi:hypothetical protein